jgi:hypothetical protein
MTMTSQDTITKSLVQTPAWFSVERVGRFKKSRFSLHTSLTKSVLLLKVSPEASKAKYILNFELFPITVEADARKVWLRPQRNRTVFVLLNNDAKVLEAWGYSLMLVASVCASKALASQHVTRFRWWKVTPSQDFVISPAQLSEMAESGDLMLFRSKHFLAKTWRTLAQQAYDHVALIICYCGTAFIIEALKDTGVRYCPIDKALLEEWRQCYSKVTYRRLTCQRTEAFQSTIVENLRTWAGRPYELTIEKLTKTQSEVNSDYKDFFCSQLVAAFYKKLDLLPEEISACSYWPTSFASCRSLSMQPGTGLSEEMEVSLSV